MILSFRIERAVNSVDPNQTAPRTATKRRLGSARCEVGTLIARGTVTLPSHKGALCRGQELCAEGRALCRRQERGREREREGVSPSF